MGVKSCFKLACCCFSDDPSHAEHSKLPVQNHPLRGTRSHKRCNLPSQSSKRNQIKVICRGIKQRWRWSDKMSTKMLYLFVLSEWTLNLFPHLSGSSPLSLPVAVTSTFHPSLPAFFLGLSTSPFQLLHLAKESLVPRSKNSKIKNKTIKFTPASLSRPLTSHRVEQSNLSRNLNRSNQVKHALQWHTHMHTLAHTPQLKAIYEYYFSLLTSKHARAHFTLVRCVRLHSVCFISS